jgi:hypothetical protein
MTTAYNRILNPRPPRARHGRYIWLEIGTKVFITSRYTLECIRARQIGSDQVDVQFNLHHLATDIVNSYPSTAIIEKLLIPHGGFRITPVHAEIVDNKPQRVYIHVAFDNLPSRLKPAA